MFDTHCHLNSSYFDGKVEATIKKAFEAGIKGIVVPGTDLSLSKKAVEIAQEFKDVYAAVGIHPHHVFQYQTQNESLNLKEELKEVEDLLKNNKVVAVGEVGVDRHYYKKTKYSDYQITKEFIDLQKEVLEQQITLAVEHKKSLILHNREAVEDLFAVLNKTWRKELSGKTVFHCCEPEERLLDFAKKNGVFIGVDGDVTYDQKKQEFIKKVPLELLVLETDSPFLIPEPLRSQKIFPNEPKNLAIIVEFLSRLLALPEAKIIGKTTRNAQKLFSLETF